ncbi:Protein of unknown function [Gryllus bimaculatus]|nr:Protein of unknown function [Gryllus bimaculatus]
MTQGRNRPFGVVVSISMWARGMGTWDVPAERPVTGRSEGVGSGGGGGERQWSDGALGAAAGVRERHFDHRGGDVSAAAAAAAASASPGAAGPVHPPSWLGTRCDETAGIVSQVNSRACRLMTCLPLRLSLCIIESTRQTSAASERKLRERNCCGGRGIVVAAEELWWLQMNCCGYRGIVVAAEELLWLQRNCCGCRGIVVAAEELLWRKQDDPLHRRRVTDGHPQHPGSNSGPNQEILNE